MGLHPRLRDVGPLPWLYYWLDLSGPDGHPSNSKVLSAIGFFSCLGMLALWGFNSTLAEGPGIGYPFVVALALVLALAFGKDVFKAALKIRMPESQPDAYGGSWGQGRPTSPGFDVGVSYRPSERPAEDLMPPVGQSRPLEGGL